MGLKEMSIIQYQNIRPLPELHKLWLPLHAFQKQLDYFEKNSFYIMSIDEALNHMEKKIWDQKLRPLSLTFDNGYIDFYSHAFPLLREKKYPSTLLISPNKIGKSININGTTVDYLSWSLLKELVENDVTIGAYEDDKWNINEIDEETVLTHIENYKKEIEDRLGISVNYFGVKEGVPGGTIRDRLIGLGYRAFLTQCPTYRKNDLYSIGRIQVDDDDFNIFLTKISKTYLFFKDRKSWVYIRKYNLDKAVHWLSETYDRMRGLK
ncbi:polysaccharide deacetylase family protein [Thermodesulfobacteriota bacterium]